MEKRSKAEETRMFLLNTAFQRIYAQGFQATSIDNIIRDTHVTKGAFFYHFKNKDAMGLAVIQEILSENIHTNLIEPLKAPGNRATIIHTTFKDFMLGVSETQLKYGCPTNNMIQEMAPLKDSFAAALLHIMEDWKTALSQTLEEGIQLQEIRHAGSPMQMAEFIIAAYEGARSLGKLYLSYAYYTRFLNELALYLKKD